MQFCKEWEIEVNGEGHGGGFGMGWRKDIVGEGCVPVGKKSTFSRIE